MRWVSTARSPPAQIRPHSNGNGSGWRRRREGRARGASGSIFSRCGPASHSGRCGRPGSLTTRRTDSPTAMASASGSPTSSPDGMPRMVSRHPWMKCRCTGWIALRASIRGSRIPKPGSRTRWNSRASASKWKASGSDSGIPISRPPSATRMRRRRTPNCSARSSRTRAARTSIPSSNWSRGAAAAARPAPGESRAMARSSGKARPCRSKMLKEGRLTDRKTWWRVVQVVGAVVLVALAVRSLARNWNDLQSQTIEWKIRPLWIALSLVITWGAYAGLIEAWRRVVESLRQRLGYWDAARITMVSNLGKYVPGKVWAIAGAAYLAQQVGVTKTAAVASAVVLQALALASGVILVAILAPGLQGVPAGYLIGGAALGVAAVGGVVVLCSRRALDAIQRRLPPSLPRLDPIAPGVML